MDCVFKNLLYSVNQTSTFQHKKRQWYRSILGFERQQGEGGDQQETLKTPTVPPRGVQPVNPNGGGARYTARLSELYGTNSSGHLWKKQTVKTNSVEGQLWKKDILPSFIGLWV